MYTVKYRNASGTHTFNLFSLASAIEVASAFGGIIYQTMPSGENKIVLF